MIICCGEALIDMLPRQMEDGSEVLLPVPGGAIFNTAIALGRLGEEAGFFSGLSTDLFGEKLAAALEASKVDYRYAVRSGAPTTLAFVKLTNGQAKYTFYDENTAGRLLSEKDLPQFGDEVTALHFGTISLISEPCGATLEALMKREHKARIMSLDPNIRASFIPDATAHRARMSRMIAMSDIVKVSDEDFDWLVPGGTFEDSAKTWIENGMSLVVLTMGAEGCRVITAHHDVVVPVQKVQVVDTVGAGDSFDGGLLAGLSRAGVLTKSALRDMDEETLRGAVELAVKVAAISVTRAGANPPWQDELN
ncbi:MAG: carbohydrate kinase [Rhizobiaceae bacterium]|nr:carbohydrate kinase [Rhizobiaceae bacterium]